MVVAGGMFGGGVGEGDWVDSVVLDRVGGREPVSAGVQTSAIASVVPESREKSYYRIRGSPRIKRHLSFRPEPGELEGVSCPFDGRVMSGVRILL